MSDAKQKHAEPTCGDCKHLFGANVGGRRPWRWPGLCRKRYASRARSDLVLHAGEDGGPCSWFDPAELSPLDDQAHEAPEFISQLRRPLERGMSDDRDAMWPDGATLEEQQVMAEAVVCGVVGALSNYVGPHAMREALKKLVSDEGFWQRVGALSARIRDHLRESDAEDDPQ